MSLQTVASPSEIARQIAPAAFNKGALPHITPDVEEAIGKIMKQIHKPGRIISYKVPPKTQAGKDGYRKKRAEWSKRSIPMFIAGMTLDEISKKMTLDRLAVRRSISENATDEQREAVKAVNETRPRHMQSNFGW